MFGQFTQQRRKRFVRQMIAWSVGMLLVVPAVMIVFPYLFGMPFGEWGSSPGELMHEGGAALLGGVWALGFLAMLAAHAPNPLSEAEREEERMKADEPGAGDKHIND